MESHMASLHVAKDDRKKKSNSYFIFIKTTIFTCVWMEETALPTEKSDVLTDSKHISLSPTSIRLEKLY